MVGFFTPSIVREICNNNKDLCDGHCSYQSFVALVTGIFWGYRSLSEIVRMFCASPSLSTLSEALRNLPARRLISRNINALSKMVQKEANATTRFSVLIDDTLSRQFGESKDNCYWFDHSLNKTILGRNYLVAVLVDNHTGRTYLLDIILLFGKKHAEYEARLKIVQTILLRLKAAKLGHLTVVADSWFASSEFFEWLDANAFTFEIEIKHNRKVTKLGRNKTETTGQNGRPFNNEVQHLTC